MERSARLLATTLSFAACALVTAACGGSSSSGSSQTASAAVADPRAAAIQKVLDAKPPTHVTPAGLNCKLGRWDSGYDKRKKQLQLVREAHVSASPNQYGPGLPCVVITWPGVPNIVKVKGGPSFNAHDYWVEVPLGRYVVDKVGEDQQVAGVSYAPFRAHFVESSLGAEMLRAKLANRPQDVSDGKALLRKDADGSWVAEI